jgi:hypothetical protein
MKANIQICRQFKYLIAVILLIIDEKFSDDLIKIGLIDKK